MRYSMQGGGHCGVDLFFLQDHDRLAHALIAHMRRCRLQKIH